MGRGLSPLQLDILKVLPWQSDLEAKDFAPSVRDLVGLMNMALTPSNRAAVSRAVSRLGARRLVGSRWGPEKCGWSTYGSRLVWRVEQSTLGYVRLTEDEFAEKEKSHAALLEQWRVEGPELTARACAGLAMVSSNDTNLV